jgi:hypothetical protein
MLQQKRPESPRNTIPISQSPSFLGLKDVDRHTRATQEPRKNCSTPSLESYYEASKKTSSKPQSVSLLAPLYINAIFTSTSVKSYSESANKSTLKLWKSKSYA